MADTSASNISQGGNVTIDAMQRVGKEEQLEQKAEQLESQSAFLDAQKDAINPFAQKLATRQKEIKSNSARIKKMMGAGEKQDRLAPITHIKDTANRFQQGNPELKSQALISLRDLIKPGDSKADILKKLADYYPDVSLADEALDFLLETTEGELYQTVKEAQDEFRQKNEREITAGRNIYAESREAADKGLGTPTNNRELYREITGVSVTGTTRDTSVLFEELSSKYAFKDLKKVIDFLLHSLGADMKAKGPSIPRGMLHTLFTETRSLQAILGVYRFFRSRMRLIEKLFQKEGLEMPAQLTFENISKQFMSLAAERYPSSAKVLQLAGKLGIDQSIPAKIIVFSQMRDAVREVAINQVYKSVQHRDELFMSFLEGLEDLEDQLEDMVVESDDEMDVEDDNNMDVESDDMDVDTEEKGNQAI